VTEVHQFLPTFAAHDAIGGHVLRLRGLLREAGYRSEIFADDIHSEVRSEASPADSAAKRIGSDAWILYHASTGSSMARRVADSGHPLIVDYHNITEARFFDRWAPAAAHSMREARRQLHELAPVTALGIGDSPYNEAELIALGYKKTAVASILVDFREYDAPPDARTAARLAKRAARGGAHWLFVGRIAPNKCQHDVIGAFAAYRAVYDPHAHLTLVGGMTSHLYWRAIENLIGELDLRDHVTMADNITFPSLLAHYRSADVFVCLSEHEGFNVPVLEAMHFGVPVVALAVTATPATVGDGGVLLDSKDPLTVATAVQRVRTDASLRTALVGAGRERVERFSLTNTKHEMLDAVRSAVEGER
jgi:glycosyltransferase involved in cell wall biosynthesis